MSEKWTILLAGPLIKVVRRKDDKEDKMLMVPATLTGVGGEILLVEQLSDMQIYVKIK